MADRPNVLWYCSDQQRFDTIGALNNPHINTPRLDRFMGESVTFTHAFCQTPICTPSRASFLTGMYPSALGVNQNGNAYFPAEHESRLITNVLARDGYDCGLVGKLHLAGAARRQEQRVDDGYRSFDYSHSHKGPDVLGHDHAEWLRSRGHDPDRLMNPQSPDTYAQGAEVRSFGGLYVPTAEKDNIPPEIHQTRWCSERSIQFVNGTRGPDQPWLLSVNPFDPHPPFDAPWEYFRRYDPDKLPGAHFKDGDLEQQERIVAAGVDFQSKPQHPAERDHKMVQASYYAMIEQVDHEFGRLLDHLDELGERENTIVIFMSDHGEALCDHGLVLKGCRFFEGLVRVPLMISWPARFQRGLVSDALVELCDIAPTLYEALGYDVPENIQGRSLIPILTGAASPDHHRDFVRTEFFGAIDHPDQTHATMYRDRRWKLVTYHGKDLFELYDLENDPWEHNDLSNNPECQEIKWDLVRRSFDAAIFAHPPGPPRTMPF